MIDYLIIGQGIAGSVLAETLLEKGCKILVLDEDIEITSSKVAAGICNPVTGRNLLKTWHADQLFPFLKTFYQKLEKKLQTTFLYETPVYRAYKNIEEQNLWAGRSSDEGWKQYVNMDVDNDKYSQFIDNPLGGWETKQSYWLNLSLFLEKYRNYLLENQIYTKGKLDYNDLDIKADRVIWKDIEAQKVIFCEGFQVIHNPFFNWLPFNPVKGEMINIQFEDERMQLDAIINQGIFIQPLKNGEYQVGATYEWKNLNNEISEKAKVELTEKLNNLLKLPYIVTRQKAAVRPATRQRRPLIGIHPEYQSLAIFNGLGTKGVSLAPFFASQFYNYLAEPDETTAQDLLDREVNIRNYNHLTEKRNLQKI